MSVDVIRMMPGVDLLDMIASRSARAHLGFYRHVRRAA
jgi:hypothetical protein